MEEKTKLIERRLDAAEAKLLDITSGAMAFRMFMKWHIPIFFVIAIGSGILIPWPGAWISGNVPYSGKFLIGAIFLCSGLRLKVDDIVLAFKCLVGSMWGIVLILALTPLLSLALVQIPISPMELPFGVALFATMPTTLSSGVILTRAANGNDTLALLLTVVTNLSAIFIIPFTLQILLAVAPTKADDGEAVEISIDPLPLILSLLLCILVPLSLGKFLSMDTPFIRALCAKPCPGSARWCTRCCSGSGTEEDGEEDAAVAVQAELLVARDGASSTAGPAAPATEEEKDTLEIEIELVEAAAAAAPGEREAEGGDDSPITSEESGEGDTEEGVAPPLCPRNPIVVAVAKVKIPMKLFMSFCLACVPWLKVSASAEKIKSIELQSLLATLLVGACAHLIFLGIAYSTSSLLPLRVAEQKAVVLMGASKTLPVAVAVIDGLPASLGNPGIMTIGCILAHFIQLLIDAYIVARWAPVDGSTPRSERWFRFKLKHWCVACRAMPCACCRGEQCGGGGEEEEEEEEKELAGVGASAVEPINLLGSS